MARAVAAVMAALVVVLMFNAATVTSRQRTYEAAAPVTLDRDALGQTLGEAVRARTVSHQDPAQNDATQWDQLHGVLEKRFPLVWKTLQREVAAQRSLLLTWKGTQSHLQPLVLMAHQDVVPVDEKTLDQWEQPPFSGAVVDGYVWGRGTVDDKVGLVSTLGAVEALIRDGFVPTRTVVLAFGHDEESTSQGATTMARYLRQRGQRPWLVMDEGLATTVGMMPGVKKPVALVGVAQKGYLSVELSVTLQGGHSSMPPAHTPVGVLGRALSALEFHQMPPRPGGVAHDMLAWVASETPFYMRLAFANMWLWRPVVREVLLRRPQSAAVLRTTTAPTMLEASPKENVLPTTARAVVNFRLVPGDSVQDVMGHIATTVADPRVVARALPGAHEPRAPTSSNSAQFALVQQAVGSVDPDVLVAPGMVTGATDSRQFQDDANAILMFRPVRMTQQDVSRVHGINERVALEDLERCVRFYVQLIRLAAGVNQESN